MKNVKFGLKRANLARFELQSGTEPEVGKPLQLLDQFWRAYGEYNRFRVLDATKSSKQKALSAKTIILSDSQGHASTIQIGIRYTPRL